MIYGKEEISGYNSWQQAKMFQLLFQSDEASKIAVQSFKKDVECANKAENCEKFDCDNYCENH